MLTFAYRLYRLSSSVRYRLRRRLTPAGWLTLAGLILTGALGVDLEHSVASQTFAVLSCLLIISVLWSFFFRNHFDVERFLPRFGTVGQPFTDRILVRNRSAKWWRELDVLEELADPRPSREEFIDVHQSSARNRSFKLASSSGWVEQRRAAVKPAVLPSLTPRGEADARLEVLPLRRGPLRFEGAVVARRDPLGLVRAFVRVRLPQTVLILPKRYRVPPISLPGTNKYQQGGVAFAAAIGEAEEFVSLRDYRPGDPLRHVHWRSSARTGRLVVKEFEDEFFVRHALILDTFGDTQQSQAFEEAVSIAASFACRINTQESLLDIMFVENQAVCFTTGRGLAHTEQALEILASVRLCRQKPFSTLQALVLQHVAQVSGCICIFLSWDQSRRELVKKLEACGLPLIVLVVTDEAGARELDSLSGEDRPGRFHVLEIGKIEAGLQVLEEVAG